MDINGRNKDKIIKDNNSANQDFLRAQPVIPSYYILKRCFYWVWLFHLSFLLNPLWKRFSMAPACSSSSRHWGDAFPIATDPSVSHGLLHRLDRMTSGLILWASSYRSGAPRGCGGLSNSTSDSRIVNIVWVWIEYIWISHHILNCDVLFFSWWLGESDFQNVGCDPGWPSHLEYKFEWWGPDFGIMGERSSPPTWLDEEEEIWAFHGYPCMKQYEALLVFFLANSCGSKWFAPDKIAVTPQR